MQEQTAADAYWMLKALDLARRAAMAGEVPVGAVLVDQGHIIGSGKNRPISNHDPSAHAEIMALRDAGYKIHNYRFPGATLYTTLEPCPMCAGAIVQARLAAVVYGATDPKGGACGSVFDLLPSDARFNHHTSCRGGVLARECTHVLQEFFQKRRSNAGLVMTTNISKPTVYHQPKLIALLWDVDGTLADTEGDGHRIAFNRAFAAMDLDWCWSPALYGELLNVTGGKERLHHFVDTMHPLLPEVVDIPGFLAELHRLKTRIYNDMLKGQGIPLRPGVLRLLKEARAAGLRQAIVTTTSQENVTTLLQTAIGEEALDWFDVIAAGTQVTAKKPAPDIYLYALRQLNLEPTACIAIEDSAIGLQAARSAGITVVVVTVTNYTREQDLTAAKLVVEDLGEPTARCQQLAGDIVVTGCVDVKLLKHLHAVSMASGL